MSEILDSFSKAGYSCFLFGSVFTGVGLMVMFIASVLTMFKP